MLTPDLLMHLRSSLRRRLLALAVVVFASLLYAAPVFAQASITVVNEKSLPRLDKNGNQTQKRPLQLNPEGVSFQDCIDDQQIQFTLQMSGFEPNAFIEVWASAGGVDCGQQVNRSSVNQLCWKVAPNIPLQINVTAKIPVRKIMAGAPPFKATALNDTIDACGQVDLANITVQFLYFSPGNAAGAAASKKDIGVAVDTVGPPAPTGIRSQPGDTRVQVSWDNISGEGGVSALTGVKVYCDPAQATGDTVVEREAGCREVPIEVPVDDAGEGGVTDAGFETVCDDGGTETIPGAECASPNFIKIGLDGQPTAIIPDAEFNAQYECGSITGNTGTTVVAEAVGGNPLMNGTRYAVAVAGTDAYGNVGALSSVRCEVPAETTDFWDSYREAGGQAGGGFCATSGPGAPTGSLAAFGIVLAAALSSLRRKWKDRR